nr:hypothetical protein [Saprospiraceae bacterium]
MQWLLLILILIVVFRYDQIAALFQGNKKNKPEIDKDKDQGDYIDYEELD